MRSLIFILVLSFSYSAIAKMAFQKQVDDKRFIVVADDNGLNQKVISDPSLDTYHPEISASGRFVAYSRGKIQPGAKVETELVVKDLTNGTVYVWTPKGNQYIHAEFSGNDRFLVFSGLNGDNGRQNIMVIDFKKERERMPDDVVLNGDGTLTFYYEPQIEIIKSDYDCYAPAVSSDGATIIYHRTKL